MGVLRRIGNFFKRNFSGVSYYDKFGFFSTGSSSTESGEDVSVLKGERISTVFSCLNVLSQEVASLPKHVKKNNDLGSSIYNGAENNIISKRPNMMQTAYSFWYSIVWGYSSRGDAYALIEKRDTKPVALYQLKHEDVSVVIVEGEVFYKVKDKIFSSSDILHFKLYTVDGIRGVSPIMYNAETLGYKLKQEKFAARSLAQKPAGYLRGAVKESEIPAIVSSWKNSFMGDKANGTPFLTGDVEYKNLMITPEEGQHIETKKSTNTDIYAMFRMNPTFVQDYERATFSNAEQQDLHFVKHTLMPHIKMIELECNKLFRESNYTSSNPLYVNFNVNGLLRGDVKTRMEFYDKMLFNGVFNADDVLELEDMPKQKDGKGEKYYIQSSMIEKGTLPKVVTNGKSSNGVTYKELLEQ